MIRYVLAQCNHCPRRDSNAQPLAPEANAQNSKVQANTELAQNNENDLARFLALLQEKYPDLSTLLETGLALIVEHWPSLPDSVQKDLASRYAELFSLFHKHRDKISRVTFWAVHDGQSWRSYMPISGRADYPMLFDCHCKPKLAFDAIFKIFQSKK